MNMTWEVHEVHERLYPDQGWTPAKVILEDEKHLHDADHPEATGWPIWHFRHTRPTEGSGSGVYFEYVFHVGLVFLSGHFVIRFYEVFFEEFFPCFPFGDA